MIPHTNPKKSLPMRRNCMLNTETKALETVAIQRIASNAEMMIMDLPSLVTLSNYFERKTTGKEKGVVDTITNEQAKNVKRS